jgi:chromosome segregation ATPase
MSTEIKKTLGITDDFDKKSADFLATALGKATSKEFDYMKYRQSLNAMQELKLDEPTSFKSAYAAARSMGVTKDGLVNSARQYLSLLMNEKTQFDTALNNQIKERVGAKHDEVVKLQQGIEQMKQKIREFESKISEFQNKIDTADDDVVSAKQKIQETKERFESAFKAFTDVISKDIERINQYL